MNCEQARDKLNAFLDRELQEAETLLMKEHLSGCPECQAGLRELQALNAWMSGYVPEPLPAGLNARVAASVGGIRPRLPWWSRMAVAASFALMLLGGFVLGTAYYTNGNSTTSSSFSFGQESLYAYFDGGSR